MGEVTFHQPTINFVLAPDPQDDQTRIDADWRKTLLALFPFRIDQIQVRDGRLRFRDLRKKPAVDVDLADVRARLRNLTNIRKPKKSSESDGEELFTTLDAVARPFGAGGFWMTLRSIPSRRAPPSTSMPRSRASTWSRSTTSCAPTRTSTSSAARSTPTSRRRRRKDA